MLVSDSVGLSRWMERIAEKHQTGGGELTVGDAHGGDPSAKGLATREHAGPGDSVARLVEGRDPGGPQLRLGVGRLASSLGVDEVESQRGDARLVHRSRETREEGR